MVVQEEVFKGFSLNLFCDGSKQVVKIKNGPLPHGLFIQKYQENALCMSGNKTLVAYINNSLGENTPIVLSLAKCHYSKAFFGGYLNNGCPTGIYRQKWKAEMTRYIDFEL